MKNKIIFLDTETTDASSEPGMIQLGYIVCDTRFNEIKRENMFFLSEKELTIGSIAIHHITKKILKQKLVEDIRSDEEKKEIAIEDFKDAYLVAHNASFDKNVLDCNGINTDNEQWIDSYVMAYNLYTEADMGYSLQYLRYFLECEFDEEINPHDALSDVIVLKEVFKKIFVEYINSGAGVNPFDDMIEDTKTGIIFRTWMLGKYKGMSVAETFKRDIRYFKWLYNTKKQNGETKDALFNTLSYYLGEKIEKK